MQRGRTNVIQLGRTAQYGGTLFISWQFLIRLFFRCWRTTRWLWRTDCFTLRFCFNGESVHLTSLNSHGLFGTLRGRLGLSLRNMDFYKVFWLRLPLFTLAAFSQFFDALNFGQGWLRLLQRLRTFVPYTLLRQSTNQVCW